MDRALWDCLLQQRRCTHLQQWWNVASFVSSMAGVVKTCYLWCHRVNECWSQLQLIKQNSNLWMIYGTTFVWWSWRALQEFGLAPVLRFFFFFFRGQCCNYVLYKFQCVINMRAKSYTIQLYYVSEVSVKHPSGIFCEAFTQK